MKIEVTYPRSYARIALVLVYEKFKLTSELRLLILIRKVSGSCAVAQEVTLRWPQRRHILNNKETHLITSLIEQVALDLDLPNRGDVSDIGHV